MTRQAQIQAKLETLGLPYKQIKVYGSQVMITSSSEATAQRWAAVLATFATVRPITPSLQHAKVNRNTVLKPSTVKVWLTWATI